MNEKERERQRQYEGDVFYEVWRLGGRTDLINDERVTRSFDDGFTPDDAARQELKHQRLARQRRLEESDLGEPDDRESEDHTCG